MLSAAIIIASYGPDFERCQLLVESVDKFLKDEIPMYIIVPSKDVNLFEGLNKSGRVRVINENSLLPWWVIRLPFSKKWRLSLCTIPLRGWVIQQMCKLNISAFSNEDYYIILDSDNVFVRPWSVTDFVNQEQQVRLLSVPGRGRNIPSHYPWHRVSGKLLGLEQKDYFGCGYIGNIVTWRRDTLLKLQEHLKRKNFGGWQRAVAKNMTISEYILYGIYSEHVLKENSGHYGEAQNIVHEYWTEKNLSDDEINGFLAKMEPHHIAAMITAKAGISVERYEKIIRKLWETQEK